MEATATTFKPGDRVVCIDAGKVIRPSKSPDLPGRIVSRSKAGGAWLVALDCDTERKYFFHVFEHELIPEAVDA